ncbi:MAG: 3-deoxy-manno-octulosonate cytidylyltransferase [Eubacterium sp.]|nr:3-deoxy-manno-octulosonate cytidylyltransferase [Eubacterium sp.]
MKIIGIIPARYQSSRFPGKPVAMIKGKPMIWWVYNQAAKVENFTELLVATDSEKIFNVCREYDIPVEMTKDTHPTGTDRLGEIAEKKEADFYVNIQGDEPLIEPAVIAGIVEYKLAHSEVEVINTMTDLKPDQDVNDKSIVKVAAAENDDLLYLSRAPIPCSKRDEAVPYKRHLGLYGISRQALLFYARSKRGYLESIEDVEMLRYLENGYRIKIINVISESIGVDNPEDIAKVEKILNGAR